MTSEELVKVGLYIAGLWQSYRSGEASPLILRRAFADLRLDVVLAAIDQLAIEHPQFAPNAQTIRARAVELASGQEPSKGDAWGELLGEIRRVGYVGTPEFSDERTARVVEQLGGWVHICQTWMVDDEMANRAHFFRLWDELTVRARRESVAALPASERKELA